MREKSQHNFYMYSMIVTSLQILNLYSTIINIQTSILLINILHKKILHLKFRASEILGIYRSGHLHFRKTNGPLEEVFGA